MNFVLREDLKDVFKKFGAVKYVDFRIGKDKGYNRFDEPEAARKVHAAAVSAKEGGLIVKNFIAGLELVIVFDAFNSKYVLVKELGKWFDDLIKSVVTKKSTGEATTVFNQGEGRTTGVENVAGVEKMVLVEVVLIKLEEVEPV